MQGGIGSNVLKLAQTDVNGHTHSECDKYAAASGEVGTGGEDDMEPTRLDVANIFQAHIEQQKAWDMLWNRVIVWQEQ